MDLYTFDINSFTDEEFNYWYNFLSPQKKQKVDRLKFTKNKKCTVAGEMLARKGISEKINIPPEELSFTTNQYGKPYVEKHDIHFNISHSDSMVVCAVSEFEVGVDVEKIRPVNLKIAKKICLEDELTYIFNNEKIDYNSTDINTIKRFFEIWTGKEAYFKCIGTGITDFTIVNTLTNKFINKPIYKDGYIIRTSTKGTAD